MLERVMQLQEERDIVRNIKKTVDEKLDNLKKSKDPMNYLAVEAFENISFRMELEIYKISEKIADLLLDKVESGFLYEN